MEETKKSSSARLVEVQEPQNDFISATVYSSSCSSPSEGDEQQHRKLSNPQPAVSSFLLPENPLLNVESKQQRQKRGASARKHDQQSEDSSENLVTATQTKTTSATRTTSDDRDSSGGGTASGANVTNSSTGSGGQESSGHDSGSNRNKNIRRSPGERENGSLLLSYYHHFHHPQYIHHHHSHHRSRRTADSVANNGGPGLQVPGDDGSDRLAASSIGTVQPATVVASRYDASSSSSWGSGAEGDALSSHHHQQQEQDLLPPHREPGYHTIRRTLNRFPGRGREESRTKRRTRIKSCSATTDSSSSMEETTVECNITKKKRAQKRKRKETTTAEKHSLNARKRTPSPSPDSSEQEGNGGGSSSGSGTEGTEGGYAGSASSNDTGSGRQPESCSSPSVSSSEESQTRGRRKRKCLRSEQLENDDSSSSSEIADFSSGSSETADDDAMRRDFDLNAYQRFPSPPLSSSNDEAQDDLEESYLSAKQAADAEHERMLESITRKRKATFPRSTPLLVNVAKRAALQTKRLTVSNLNGRPPILTVGSDLMAHVLTFLQPPDILQVLTMPLSKDWRKNFTLQPELWRVLCLVEPFKADMDSPSLPYEDDKSTTSNDDSVSSSSDSYCSFLVDEETEKRLLQKYRRLYTAFVRCMKYLSQIREDAINGRPPAYIDYGFSGTTTDPGQEDDDNVASRTTPSSPPPDIASRNKNLQDFLAHARGVVAKSRPPNDPSDGEIIDDNVPKLQTAARVATVPKKRKRASRSKEKDKKKSPRLGPSMITGRLLGPTASGEPGNMNLPWSCAIYSIVNWMRAYKGVEGIQTLCLKVLPFLLEDEQQRQTAQNAGLTDIVLHAMVMFPQSEQLHIAAFHTIVLLARPHGGREGMLFHSSMTAAGIFGANQQDGKSGIAVMLDSMQRFEDNPVLLAMSCWALVNIALAPEQKAVLVRLGGIQATTNAMYRHPFSAEVQFRGLFALINLVIPFVEMSDGNRQDAGDAGDDAEDDVAVPVAAAMEEELGDSNQPTERQIIDELVSSITSLVVRAMKNFCSSEAILNRACLVLHNLSLTEDYHTTLLWTPQCYQMLEWCLANYQTDQVLQQSATGTLHRLQLTLSHNEDLRARFSDSIRTQQHLALEQAHNEARRLHEQQEALMANEQVEAEE